MSEFDELLTSLRAQCPMRTREFTFASREISIWCTADNDQLLDALLAKPEDHIDRMDERMPYWAEIWPSSVLMAETLVKRSEQLPAGPWLELGCGPGLAGITAACLGLAGTCSDYMPDALRLVQLNALQNGCADKVDTRLLDWRTVELPERVPWILAADVVYETRLIEPLTQCLERLLASDGELWLAEPGRDAGKQFLEHLRTRGWRREELAVDGFVTLHRLVR